MRTPKSAATSVRFQRLERNGGAGGRGCTGRTMNAPGNAPGNAPAPQGGRSEEAIVRLGCGAEIRCPKVAQGTIPKATPNRTATGHCTLCTLRIPLSPGRILPFGGVIGGAPRGGRNPDRDHAQRVTGVAQIETRTLSGKGCQEISAPAVERGRSQVLASLPSLQTWRSSERDPCAGTGHAACGASGP